ncbi:MAG: hypothetical protein ACYDHH_14315 [Solirubrobacteraceae bacterium]
MTAIILLNLTMIVLAFGTVAAGLVLGFRLKPRSSSHGPGERRTVLPGSHDSYRLSARYRITASIATATNSSAR